MDGIFSLQNKKILITGASSGIGKCIAIECSKYGANLIITGRDQKKLYKTFSELSGIGHTYLAADLTNADSFENLCNNIPIIDGIVMCAGIPCSTPIKHNSKTFLIKLFETNTFINFELSKHLISCAKIRKNGSVVFISSVAAERPYKGNSIYSASKAAINSFSKIMALELSYKEIRVNCISPGIIPTKENDSAFSDNDLSIQETKTPLGFGEPSSIANGCIYLLSDASKWVTGTNLVIDGGQSLI